MAFIDRLSEIVGIAAKELTFPQDAARLANVQFVLSQPSEFFEHDFSGNEPDSLLPPKVGNQQYVKRYNSLNDKQIEFALNTLDLLYGVGSLDFFYSGNNPHLRCSGEKIAHYEPKKPAYQESRGILNPAQWHEIILPAAQTLLVRLSEQAIFDPATFAGGLGVRYEEARKQWAEILMMQPLGLLSETLRPHLLDDPLPTLPARLSIDIKTFPASEVTENVTTEGVDAHGYRFLLSSFAAFNPFFYGERFGIQEVTIDTTQALTETKTTKHQQHPEVTFYSFSPLMQNCGFFYSLIRASNNDKGILNRFRDGGAYAANLQNIAVVALQTAYEMFVSTVGRLRDYNLAGADNTPNLPEDKAYDLFSGRGRSVISFMRPEQFKTVAQMLLHGFESIYKLAKPVTDDLASVVQVGGTLIMPAYADDQVFPVTKHYEEGPSITSRKDMASAAIQGSGQTAAQNVPATPDIEDTLAKYLNSTKVGSNEDRTRDGGMRDMFLGDTTALHCFRSSISVPETATPGIDSEMEGIDFTNGSKRIDYPGSMFQLLLIASAASVLANGATFINPISHKAEFVGYGKQPEKRADVLGYALKMMLQRSVGEGDAREDGRGIGVHPVFFISKMLYQWPEGVEPGKEVMPHVLEGVVLRSSTEYGLAAFTKLSGEIRGAMSEERRLQQAGYRFYTCSDDAKIDDALIRAKAQFDDAVIGLNYHAGLGVQKAIYVKGAEKRTHMPQI